MLRKQEQAPEPDPDPQDLRDLKTKIAKILGFREDQVLGAREDTKGVLFAVIDDGRKVQITGKTVVVLAGPGHVES